ncbi:MAG: 16S rRNA (adenine(1518)-N(6)/adenine(1519)-N(6))-dimethyltransferase RsmA [Deltaproteobacteria bacterium]|nr:16S rRNA (adenine(1518)-N(6)/adenine(1519)-N(6))-dimethyltransferase RsmA [Deltaproteobacteria bacterium]MBI3389674.1 16S rRNA (adenine(1518)-N(6)/adenine(1519)-N(6))-dimethyltransferase RsmA [Deltaproteobacteria bacterium]
MPRHAGATPRGKLRRELAAIDRRPRKRLAQHLLADPGVIRRIVDLAHLTGTQSVLEIGPGLGALTDELARRCRRLCLIELDRDFAARLRERFADHTHVTVVERDVLKADLRALCVAPTIVVANLPYNISTPVLFQLLDCADLFSKLVLMLQREVADRIRSQAGDDAYGALSVLVQFRAHVRHGVYVDPAAFVPRPKVQSEVIVVEPYATPPISVRDPSMLRRVVRAAFQQRRKQLVNSLGAALADPAGVLAAVGIDYKRRAETVTLEEFAQLADAATPLG